ncbi:MAG: flavodoxin family protein [Thermoplasmata archaeon]
MRVLAVNGSPRKKSNTKLMVDAAAKELRSDGVEVEVIWLAGLDVRPCNACGRCCKKAWDCPIEDDAISVLRKIASADGVLMASPVYFGGVTAQLKALFDRSYMAYQAFEFRDKVGGALTVGGGAHGGQELTVGQIITFFLTHDMIVANAEGGSYGGMCAGNDPGDVLNDSEGMKSVKALAKRMARLLRDLAK